MRGNDSTGERTRGGVSRWLGKLMKCLWSEEKLREENRMIPSPESIATKDSVSRYSSRAGSEQKQDTGNIEEAESSLRESGCLNYEVHFLDFLFNLSFLFLFHFFLSDTNNVEVPRYPFYNLICMCLANNVKIPSAALKKS